MRKGILPGLLPLFAGLFISFTSPVSAATYYITVDAFGFDPDYITIDPGDEIIWYNNDDELEDSYTVTSDLPSSDDDYWDVLLVEYLDGFSKIFNNPGIFTYSDELGGSDGTIVVRGPAAEITLVAPRLESGKFLFDATGLTSGKQNVLLSSTNLVDWNPVSTNTAAGNSMTFTNAVSKGVKTFRLLQLP